MPLTMPFMVIQHGLVGPLGNLCPVGVVQQEHPGAGKALALGLGVAVEDRGELLAGNGILGPVVNGVDIPLNDGS